MFINGVWRLISEISFDYVLIPTGLHFEIKRMTTLKIGTPKEVFDGEARVAMTPDSAVQLQKLGYDCALRVVLDY